jgi:hypothetical protein
MIRNSHRLTEARMKGKEVFLFVIGAHTIHVIGTDDHWEAKVDGVLVDGRFGRRSDAWSAGVTEVDRLDRVAPPTPAATSPRPC